MKTASRQAGHHGGAVPPSLFAAGAGLVGLTIVSAGVAHFTGRGEQTVSVGQAVQTVLLRFDDKPDGAIAVSDARDGHIVYVVAPGSNGFIRSTMRGLARERKRSDIGAGPPFRLTRWSDGTLSLDDAATGRHIALDAFGSTNAKAFAVLVEHAGGEQ